MKNPSYFIALASLVVASLILASCTPKPAELSTQPPVTAVEPTDTVRLAASLTPSPTSSPIPSATSVPFPILTLKPGDFYFSVDGKPGFIFSRNLAGYQQTHYKTFLDWSRAGGSQVARIQLDSFGMGYTSTGGVDPNWVAQWDQVFDQAEADGIYILPTFSPWYDWNASAGYSTWKSNPLNQANGGPVKTPGELFQKGSATQTIWLNWMQALVKRWQDRKNILAWEIFSEVNLASGNTEATGIDFVNASAALIRANDPSGRPVTASIADTGTWPNFYRNTSIDFINIHPYPPLGQLDKAIVTEIRNQLARYNRPVLIGESGLSADTPDSAAGKLTVAQNARTGIRHAIWAAVVSGAMNGRSLWWEDGVGIYFPNLGFRWMEQYKTDELPAANFVSGVDFSGFKPLTATSTSGIWGAALGNDKSVLGWFRDAGSEPPNWALQPVISRQTVTITLPGLATNWRVDFYDTRDGTTMLGSITVSPTGNTITIPLPDFKDDIAFKISPGVGTGLMPTPAPTDTTGPGSVSTPVSAATTNPIAGTWSGSISNLAGTFSTLVKLSVPSGCRPGQVCGTFSAPQLPCSGVLFLQTIKGDMYLFQEQNAAGAASCLSGGYEQLQLLKDGTLSYGYLITPGSAASSTGILKQP